MFLPRSLFIQADDRRRLATDCESKRERDAQVIITVLILSSWTTETLSPPAATSSHRRPPEPPSNPRTSVRSCNDHGTLVLL